MLTMPRESRTLFIRNLPYSCRKEKLEDVFSEYGPIKECFVVMDKNTGKSRGIGYVTYTLRDDAIKTKDQRISIDGRKVLIDFADITRKVKDRKKKKKYIQETDQPVRDLNQSDDGSEDGDDKDDDNDDDEEDIKTTKSSTQSKQSDKFDPKMTATLKYHKAKIILLTGLGAGLTEEKLNKCLQKLNVKHVAETKLVSDSSAHVKFKCIRDAKRALNRLHNYEYQGSSLSAKQLSKDTANVPQKTLKKCRLIVRNLAFKCKEKDLQKKFEQFGDISEVKVNKNLDGQSLGFGFVQFSSISDAKQAIDAMNSTKIKGRPIAVDWAIPKNRYESGEDSKEPELDSAEEEEDEGSFSGDGDLSEDDLKPLETDKTSQLKDKSSGKRKRMDSDDEGFSDDEDDDDDGSDDSAGSDDSDDEVDDDNSEEEDNKLKKPKKYDNRKEDVDEGKTIFIRNVSYDTEEDSLAKFFEKYGELEYARIVIDFNTDHSKGMAFVKFKTKESADQCLEDAGKNVITLDGKQLFLNLAVSRQKAMEFKEKKNKEKKDNRNLYLAREGYVRPGTQSATGLSDTDLKKRAQVEMMKRQKLKNINIFVSTLRLCIRNIPITVTDQKLRAIYLKAAQDKSAKIKECRIMRDLTRVNSSGVGKSRGYGFVSFTEHQHALNALRHTNNNPDIFGEKKRLIVEFSLENRKAIEAKEKRINRQQLKKEILKKNSEGESTNKKKEIDKMKVKAVQKPSLSLIKLSDTDKKFKAKLPKGMPSHMGPKIRHKPRPSQQVKKKKQQKNFNKREPREEKFSKQQPREEGPARKKHKKSKKEVTDSFDRLVSNYKNKFMNQKKNKKWFD